MDDIEEWYFNMRFLPALPTRNERVKFTIFRCAIEDYSD
jgi:hypothetical protein